MTAHESSLRIQEMLEFQPGQGQILLKGARVLLMNADALGMLRRDLISVLGRDRAKGFLLRYGFECGYNDAISVRQQNPDCSDQFWSEQGPLLHTLEGVVHVTARNMQLDRVRGSYYVESIWTNSYEADQHLRHFGVAEDPVCWTLVGYAGGYSSAVVGHRVVFKEVRCVGRGDPCCESVGRTIGEWGPEIEPELPFYGESKIAEELEEAHRRIQQQHRQLQEIMAMHEQLSRLVLEGKGRQAIAETVGRMLGAPVLVEDRYLRPLAIWIPPDTAGAPQPYLMGEIVQQYPDLRHRLRTVERMKRAVELGPKDHASLQTRMVAPIILGSDVMGYLSVLRTDAGEGELVRMVTERAAAVMGLELLKERTALETEHRLKGEFLEELLVGTASVESVRNRAQYMGHDLDRPHRFLLIRLDRPLQAVQPGTENEVVLGLRKELFELVRSVLSLLVKNPLVIERGEGVLLLIQTGAGGLNPSQVAKVIQQQVREAELKVSISICISRESLSLKNLRAVHDECHSAAQLQGNLGRSGGVFSVEEMGSFQLLYAGLRQDGLRTYAERTLDPIRQYDSRQGSQLLLTLYTFLAHECNLQRTAQELNISLSGLKYRLGRLREVGEVNLEDPEVRFDLQLSLKILMADGTMKWTP